jgi:hypothetical protein
MKKILLYILLLISVLGVVNLEELLPFFEDEVTTFDFEDSGIPEWIELDFEDSGIPEWIELDFEDSGIPEWIELDFEDSGIPEWIEL